jgi:hypothetical protein
MIKVLFAISVVFLYLAIVLRHNRLDALRDSVKGLKDQRRIAEFWGFWHQA